MKLSKFANVQLHGSLVLRLVARAAIEQVEERVVVIAAYVHRRQAVAEQMLRQVLGGHHAVCAQPAV